VLLGGCANGDFGRLRPSLVHDDIHSWIGADVVGSIDRPAARYGLTEDERQLRDLAYPLIEPPFARNRWYSILNEYGVNLAFQRGRGTFDQTGYSRELMAKPARSMIGRYAQLIDDIRNDIVRIGPFFRVAARVADIDLKRQQALAYIVDLQPDEHAMALIRIEENRGIMDWVHHCLNERALAYRYALERLVIASPSPMAVEAERALNQLRLKIGENSAAALDAGPIHPSTK
jgi:hypothetical protein